MGEALVLDHQRDVRLAQAQVKLPGEGLLLVVADDEEGRQSHVGLLGREAVRVRVVPVGACPVGDGEGVLVALARSHRIGRMPGLPPGAVHAVPMNDGRLGQPVGEGGLKLLPLAQNQDGIQEPCPLVRGRVSQHGRIRGRKCVGGLRCRQGQLALGSEKAEQPGPAWQRQRSGAELAGRGSREQHGKAEASHPGDHGGLRGEGQEISAALGHLAPPACGLRESRGEPRASRTRLSIYSRPHVLCKQ